MPHTFPLFYTYALQHAADLPNLYYIVVILFCAQTEKEDVSIIVTQR